MRIKEFKYGGVWTTIDVDRVVAVSIPGGYIRIDLEGGSSVSFRPYKVGGDLLEVYNKVKEEVWGNG